MQCRLIPHHSDMAPEVIAEGTSEAVVALAAGEELAAATLALEQAARETVAERGVETVVAMDALAALAVEMGVG